MAKLIKKVNTPVTYNNCKHCKGMGLIINPKSKRLQECPKCS